MFQNYKKLQNSFFGALISAILIIFALGTLIHFAYSPVREHYGGESLGTFFLEGITFIICISLFITAGEYFQNKHHKTVQPEVLPKFSPEVEEIERKVRSSM